MSFLFNKSLVACSIRCYNNPTQLNQGYKIMKASTLSLLIGALVAAVHQLDKNMALLDSVTNFNTADQEANERLANKHKSTIARLDGLVCDMRAADIDGERSVLLDPIQVHSVNRAVADHIAELEKAMAYFCQMKDAEFTVRSFQEKIEALHMAVFQANSWVRC